MAAAAASSAATAPFAAACAAPAAAPTRAFAFTRAALTSASQQRAYGRAARHFSSASHVRLAASQAAAGGDAPPQAQQQQQQSRTSGRRTAWLLGGVALVSFFLGRASLLRDSEDEEEALRLQQFQQLQEAKHVRGERKLPSLIETPTDGVAAATPSQMASAAGVPATFSAAGAPPSAAASGEEEPSTTHPDHSSCRACRDGGEAAKLSAYEAQLAAEADANAAAAASGSSAAPSAPSAACPPCFAYSHSLCPLNRAEVGRASWAYLHTVAAYYPDAPTARQQSEMAEMLRLYVKLYPCGYCADRSMEHLQREPLEQHVLSQEKLSQWMCRMHNEVNERLGKPIFDCQYTNQRWRDGPPSGECD